jgi:acyl-CoA dehydrogenase
MQGLGSGPISLFGCPEIQKRYLPEVATGRLIAALAMSEAKAGSDVSALETTATRKGDEYILNGEKTWISNAGIADFYVAFARTGEAPGAKGLSAFLVDASLDGFSVTEQIETISPHPLGTIAFHDCKVPTSHLLGNAGEGFKVAMATLDVFRSTVGAAALGFARRALKETLAYTGDRTLFGEKLIDFQMTQQKLADMATEIDASALLVYRAAWLKDSGQPRVSKEASMAKMYATEAAQRVIDQAVQLFGGKGVVHGAVVERLYRDIRPLRIYEGATEVQKIVIARSLVD